MPMLLQQQMPSFELAGPLEENGRHVRMSRFLGCRGLLRTEASRVRPGEDGSQRAVIDLRAASERITQRQLQRGRQPTRERVWMMPLGEADSPVRTILKPPLLRRYLEDNP